MAEKKPGNWRVVVIVLGFLVGVPIVLCCGGYVGLTILGSSMQARLNAVSPNVDHVTATPLPNVTASPTGDVFVPPPPGKATVIVDFAQGDRVVKSWITDTSPPDVIRAYREFLTLDGWVISFENSTDQQGSLVAAKAGRSFGVQVAPDPRGGGNDVAVTIERAVGSASPLPVATAPATPANTCESICPRAEQCAEDAYPTVHVSADIRRMGIDNCVHNCTKDGLAQADIDCWAKAPCSAVADVAGRLPKGGCGQ